MTNTNQIVTDRFSNPASGALYTDKWPGEPETASRYENGQQCGGCSFYAAFDADWGLCCHPDSRHRLETVFEHFTCPTYVEDGWDGHHFMTLADRDLTASFEKQTVAIGQILLDYITAHHLGIATDKNTNYMLDNSGTLYKPDLGFIANGRAIQMRGAAYRLAPDLAIKIVTSFDGAEALNREVLRYIETGTRQVWVLYPYASPGQTIHVYTRTTDAGLHARILTQNDTLDGDSLLPGFRVSVRDLFSTSATRRP